MKELSIFVDESGDFGEYAKHSPFYIITMILHDQSRDISRDIAKLRSEFINLGYEDDFVVHTGPLIRKEEIYCACFPTTGNIYGLIMENNSYDIIGRYRLIFPKIAQLIYENA